MQQLGVHDNHVTGYAIDGVRHTLALHTERSWLNPIERVDVRFEGVHAHHLVHHDYHQNILFDVEEVDLGGLLEDEWALFEGGRRYGWPGPWNTTAPETLAWLRNNGVRAWHIDASVGLSGWVLAQSCRAERV
jgi:hypothetical protein